MKIASNADCKPVFGLLTRAAESITLLLLMTMVTMTASAQGSDQTLYDVYRLSSAASSNVDNDLLVATLVVQEEDKDAAVLANRVNASMSWAVNILRPFATIETKTRDYQTYPRYDNSSAGKLIGWRATQSIELRTDDFPAAGKVIHQLQEKLKIQGIRLSLKPQTREKTSDLLIVEALDAFKERARLVQRNMNSTNFKILEVDVRTQHNASVYGQDRMMASEDTYSSRLSKPAPSIVAGSTLVSVQIEGRIQLD